jgi:hypothetical protein
MSEIKNAFKGLTPEQQSIVRDKRVSGARSPDEWLTLLNPVAEFDRQGDNVRAGGGGFWARRFAKKHDVPNGLRSLVIPLLPILREDHDPAKPLELTIDMTGAKQDAKQVGKGEPYKRGRYTKIVDTFYDDAWLRGRAQFADGADVQFTVIDHMRHSQRRKRSSSGKIKFKSKAKKKTEVAVQVSFPARNYATATKEASSAGIRREEVKPEKRGTVVSLNRVLPADRIDATPHLDHVLQLIGAAYDRVDPSRRKKL